MYKPATVLYSSFDWRISLHRRSGAPAVGQREQRLLAKSPRRPEMGSDRYRDRGSESENGAVECEWTNWERETDYEELVKRKVHEMVPTGIDMVKWASEALLGVKLLGLKWAQYEFGCIFWAEQIGPNSNLLCNRCAISRAMKSSR